MKKFILIAITMVAMPCWAYKIHDIQVSHYGSRFLMTFEASIAAPLESVKKVIYDFENADDLTPAVISTQVHRYDANTARIITKLRPCLYLMCKTLEKLSIASLSESEIAFNGVAGAGSFRSISEVVKLEQIDNDTKIRYKSVISPKFFVPKWLGLRFLRGTTKKYLGKMLNNIENKALEESENDHVLSSHD